jgi:hypothetical protein
MVACTAPNSRLKVSGTPDSIQFASNPDMKIDRFGLNLKTSASQKMYITYHQIKLR